MAKGEWRVLLGLKVEAIRGWALRVGDVMGRRHVGRRRCSRVAGPQSCLSVNETRPVDGSLSPAWRPSVR